MLILAKKAQRANSLCLAISLLLTGGSAGCGAQEGEGTRPPDNQMYNPIGIAAHPDGRYLFVSNGVFDRLYNASTVIMIDTFAQKIIDEVSLEIDLFSGELGLARLCNGSEGESEACRGQLIGAVTSRDQGKVTVFEVLDQDSVPRLECGQGAKRRCASNYVIESGEGELGSDGPFSLSFDQTGAFISHINSNSLSRWTLLSSPPYLRKGCSIQLPGASFVTINPRNGVAAISDRFGNRVYRAAVETSLDGRCTFTLGEPINVKYSSLQSEGRGIAYSADGSRLYAVSGAEGVLRIYAVDQGDQLLAALPVGQDAQLVRVAGVREGEQRPTGWTHLTSRAELDRLGEGLVYVTSLADQLVTVIDPVSLTVIGTIKVGKGPTDIVFMLNEMEELRGYVTLFEGHAISVLDLQPGSPQRFTQIGEIK